jgi:hypothetical protein
MKYPRQKSPKSYFLFVCFSILFKDSGESKENLQVEERNNSIKKLMQLRKSKSVQNISFEPVKGVLYTYGCS